MIDRLRGAAETAPEPPAPKIEPLDVFSTYGRFLVEPLESGFGITLGNALRRVLLSALPGAAVTRVKIDQVQHEFQPIPHVREDTVGLLLNIKKIRLRAYSDRPGRLILDRQGPGVVTAADIEVQGDFEIVNPDLYLATIDSPEGRLSIEFQVEHGKGYVPATSRESGPIGVIPVDAIFTPIRKVNFAVEPMRIGVTNYDRLVLELWTDGTIQPLDAISRAAAILIDHFRLFTDLKKPIPRQIERARSGANVLPPQLYDTPIDELDLSVRTYNALKRAQITKIGQVVEMSDDDLMAVRNFGRKSLDELRQKLAQRGFIPLGSASTAKAAESASADEEEEEEIEYLREADGTLILDEKGNPIPKEEGAL
ncbi:MAG: DNA-directed RNA polymerase subunit alpha [Chloroflexota bacterium]|nr:DNA-directed RNA polymerase subunit alpha [Dehalococcoidia bacterium]MDW8254814.1 DNA-directed RNA polymerase subunit alpha [Chloroflexota bacterium]